MVQKAKVISECVSGTEDKPKVFEITLLLSITSRSLFNIKNDTKRASISTDFVVLCWYHTYIFKRTQFCTLVYLSFPISTEI